MRGYFTLPVILVLALLLAALTGSFLLQDSGPTGARRQSAASSVIPVDEKMYLTARHLAQVADTAEEHTLARETMRLADRELDQAFASAAREAAVKVPPANQTIKDLQTRLAATRDKIEADRTQLDKLTKSTKQDEDSAAQIDLAKAQLTLDEDELEDAKSDLAQAGGDRKSVLDRALEEHQAAQHSTVTMRGLSGPVPASAWGELTWWMGLNARAQDVEAARAQVLAKSRALLREHAALEAITKKQTPVANPAQEDDEEDTAVMVDRLRRLSDQRRTANELDKRGQDLQQLGNVYQRWLNVIGAREREITYHLLRSVALVLAIVLVALFAMRGARIYISKGDSRNRHQALTLARAIIWALALALAAIVFFGPPTEVSTLIGLTTAGLTVALKDFIASLFGWFALIGKNGVHIGDWVEIEGIGGEVVDIGLFRTELLELGNWTNTGRPTGRRVTFMNKYAIEHHYFNFSTTGQWLWDELHITMPPTGHPYEDARKVLEIVEEETHANSQAAERDWTEARAKIATGNSPAITARPTVDLRPSLNGMEVYVRYVTRAPQRYETKSRLFQAVFAKLRSASSAATA